MSLLLETQSVLYIYLFFIFYFYFLFVIYLFNNLFIFCNGQGVTTKSEKKKVTAEFDKNKSGEYKKVRTRAADSYTGVS